MSSAHRPCFISLLVLLSPVLTRFPHFLFALITFNNREPRARQGHIQLHMKLTYNHCSLLNGMELFLRCINIWMGRAALGGRGSQLFPLIITQDSKQENTMLQAGWSHSEGRVKVIHFLHTFTSFLSI